MKREGSDDSSVRSNWLLVDRLLRPRTVVLLATFCIFRRLNQPARRLSVAWSALGGLAALAVVTALPTWPRISWPGLPKRLATDRPSHRPTRVTPGAHMLISDRAMEARSFSRSDRVYPDPSDPGSQERSSRTWYGGCLARRKIAGPCGPRLACPPSVGVLRRRLC